MPIEQIREPWRSFLSVIDSRLEKECVLYCVGGFVLVVLYDLERPTGDLDVIEFVPPNLEKPLLELAGEFSDLSKQYGLYLQSTKVAQYPENYEARLQEMLPGVFRKLRLFALDPYDIVLSKLDRNSPRDREDVKYLAKRITLDLDELRNRFEKEFKPGFVGNSERINSTFELWIEMIEEHRHTNQQSV